MLYTVVDCADIFYQIPETTECRRENGCLLEGQMTPRGFRVNRLISTNPKDYLNETYQPGSILEPIREQTEKRTDAKNGNKEICPQKATAEHSRFATEENNQQL